MNHPQSGKNEISILLVEDERISREIMGRIISMKFPDVKILTAENGKAGLDAFRTYHPDIVITDISMPVMDGIRMATEILKSAPGTPIFITTAHNEMHCELDSLDAGRFHFLQKPIKHESLFKAIQEIVDPGRF